MFSNIHIQRAWERCDTDLRLNIPLHACIRTLTHAHTYIYIRMHLHTYTGDAIVTYVHTYIHIPSYIHLHVYVHTYIQTQRAWERCNTYKRLIMNLHTYIHTLTQAHTYIYVRTYVRIYTGSASGSDGGIPVCNPPTPLPGNVAGNLDSCLRPVRSGCEGDIFVHMHIRMHLYTHLHTCTCEYTYICTEMDIFLHIYLRI